MRTEYYVKGKKSSLGGYLNAADNNGYVDELRAKAKKYYKKHPDEWEQVKDRGFGIDPESWMIMSYESTDEGKKFQKEWSANKEKRLHNTAGLMLLVYALIIIGCIVGCVTCC